MRLGWMLTACKTKLIPNNQNGPKGAFVLILRV